MPRLLNARKLIRVVGGKALVIPKEGWNAANFYQHGGPMIVALARVAKITQRRAAAVMARTLYALFKRQLDAVIRRVSGQRAAIMPGRKVDLEIAFGQHEDLWHRAMQEVFREAGIEIVAEISPAIQSVMGQGYSKVGLLLGQDADPTVNPKIARDARDLARQVTAVNDTTREQISRKVRYAIEQGMSVSETASLLERELPPIFGHRALTIARTELNNAWSLGAANSFLQSETLTHISVIGCEAREPRSPHWNGQSTCNYPDLPVHDLDAFLEVGFHPSHSGNFVPSRFRNADGSVDPEAERPSEAIDDSATGQPLPDNP